MKKEAYFKMMGLDKEADIDLSPRDYLNNTTLIGGLVGWKLGDYLHKKLHQEQRKKPTWKTELDRVVYAVPSIAIGATLTALLRKKLLGDNHA